jgi:cyclic lactone autoinducer peptide
MKGGIAMKKLMSIAKKASTALAALALVVAATSVPSACYHWFAQPVEPEELRNLVNNK